MKQNIRYDRKNSSTRIIRGPVNEGARQMNTSGEDMVTSRSLKRTKKSAAVMLKMDDDRPFLNPDQRRRELERAGDAYGNSSSSPGRPADPFNRGKEEGIEAYTKRIMTLISQK